MDKTVCHIILQIVNTYHWMNDFKILHKGLPWIRFGVFFTEKNEIKLYLHVVPLQNINQSFIYRSRLKNVSAKIYTNTQNFTNQYIHAYTVITNYPTITDRSYS